MNEIHCQDPWFSKIRDGVKKIEGRKNCEKYASLQPGEVVKFYCDQKSFLAEVVKVVKYPNLEDYLTIEGIENALPGVKSFNEAVDIYLGFNSREKLNKAGGFLAIHINVIDKELKE